MEKYFDYLLEICIKTCLMILIIAPFWKYFENDEIISLALALSIIQNRYGDNSDK